MEEEVVPPNPGDDNLSLSQAATDIIENDDTLTGVANNGNVVSSNVMEEDGGESKTSSDDGLAPPPSHEDLIAEIQAGVGELIARMKETPPESSSYLDSCYYTLSSVW